LLSRYQKNPKNYPKERKKSGKVAPLGSAPPLFQTLQFEYENNKSNNKEH
jgi:hypothetical protein